MNMSEKQQKYAELLVKLGVNVQKDQELVIRCAADVAPFARLVAKAAYECGAREVIVHFRDDQLSRLRYEYAPLEVFEQIPAWEAESMNYYAARGAAFLSIVSEDPEALKGVDSKKMMARTIAAHEAFRGYYDRMDKNELQWCVAAVPSVEWAVRVFPDKSADEAVEALWEAILRQPASRKMAKNCGKNTANCLQNGAHCSTKSSLYRFATRTAWAPISRWDS